MCSSVAHRIGVKWHNEVPGDERPTTGEPRDLANMHSSPSLFAIEDQRERDRRRARRASWLASSKGHGPPERTSREDGAQ